MNCKPSASNLSKTERSRKRGLLLIPNEKVYISIAHTDEDVDRTLQICDDAFRTCAS